MRCGPRYRHGSIRSDSGKGYLFPTEAKWETQHEPANPYWWWTTPWWDVMPGMPPTPVDALT